jgi:hypothetical protein
MCINVFFFLYNSKIVKLEEELRLCNNALKSLEHNEEKVCFILCLTCFFFVYKLNFLSV